jgi:biotin transport system substrate-specific component
MESASVLEGRINKALLYIFIPLAFAVLTYLGSQVSIYLPFTPVPITLQVLTVILAGLMLGPRLGALSQLEYVMAGVLGAPVFAGGKSGLIALLGPTGGYIVGFVFAAYVTGTVYSIYRKGSNWSLFLSSALGDITILFLGAAWLAVGFILTGSSIVESISKSVMVGIVPFIGIDFLKVMVAAIFVRMLAMGGLLPLHKNSF